MLQKTLAFIKKDDLGQDLAECCLILALVCVVAIGVIIKVNGGISNIWTAANNTTAAGATASGSAPAASPADTPASRH